MLLHHQIYEGEAGRSELLKVALPSVCKFKLAPLLSTGGHRTASGVREVAEDIAEGEVRLPSLRRCASEAGLTPGVEVAPPVNAAFLIVQDVSPPYLKLADLPFKIIRIIKLLGSYLEEADLVSVGLVQTSCLQ